MTMTTTARSYLFTTQLIHYSYMPPRINSYVPYPSTSRGVDVRISCQDVAQIACWMTARRGEFGESALPADLCKPSAHHRRKTIEHIRGVSLRRCIVVRICLGSVGGLPAGLSFLLLVPFPFSF